MTMRARLLLLVVSLLTIAFVASSSLTVAVTRDRLVRQVDVSLVRAHTRPSKPLYDSPSFSDATSREDTSGNKLALAVLAFSPDGTLDHAYPAGFSDDPEPLPDVDVLPRGNFARQVGHIFTANAVDGTDVSYRVLIVREGNGDFYLIAAPLAGVHATIATLTRVLVATSVGVVLIAAVFTGYILRHELRPIEAMIGAAGRIADGDLSHRVAPTAPTSEVGQLALALNTMLGRIEASFTEKEASEQQLRAFVADASHELRTPLTSIRGYAELFRSGAVQSPEALERVMARIESEGDRMARLVDDLLLLARLDQGQEVEREAVDLVRIVQDAVADARVTDPQRNIRTDLPTAALVSGDAHRLRQVIDNLVTNARVHTDPNTSITVRIQTTAEMVILQVQDQGPGMEQEHASHVFDRFYRVDASRTRAAGGAGLGLSIVQSIVSAHDGTVSLDTAPGRGTTITVRLRPATSSASTSTR